MARFFKQRLGKLLSLKTGIVLALVILLVWVSAAFALDQKQIFLPGETSEGHHVFEASCASCHEGFKPVSAGQNIARELMCSHARLVTMSMSTCLVVGLTCSQIYVWPVMKN